MPKTKKPLTPSQLVRVRSRYALTQADLSGELGVTRNTVARWEMGLYPVPHWVRFFVNNLLPGIRGKGGARVSTHVGA